MSELPRSICYTDGVDTWIEEGYYGCHTEHASCLNQTIEQQFAQRGLYNVPQSVIDRLKKKAKEDYGNGPLLSQCTEMVGPEPENMEPLLAQLSSEVEKTVAHIHKSYFQMVGLGAEGLLEIGLTDDQWGHLLIYVSYFQGGRQQPFKKDDTEWLSARGGVAFSEFRREVRFFRQDPTTTETTT